MSAVLPATYPARYLTLSAVTCNEPDTTLGSTERARRLADTAAPYACRDCGGRKSRADAERCRSCWWADLDATELTRFHARIDRSGGPDACWPWTGALSVQGYGRWHRKQAHRRVLTEKLGRPIEGETRHTCDNPPCCNPAHLIEGSHADNVRDMVERGRSLAGRRLSLEHRRKVSANNGGRKLTDGARAAIRDGLGRGERQSVLAAQYGVSQSLISRIKAGTRWSLAS